MQDISHFDAWFSMSDDVRYDLGLNPESSLSKKTSFAFAIRKNVPKVLI